MAKETLFSILLRAPWWMSILAAIPLFGAVQLFLPPLVALCSTFPFIGIAAWAGWKQLRTPSPANVEEILGKMRAMSWDNFSAIIGEAFKRDGYAVAPATGDAADFEATRNNRMALVSCKRWKVAQTGIGPLRDLYEAKKAREAQDCIYVAAGGFTDNARDFALKNSIRLVSDGELAQLVARVERASHRWKLF